ncbi:TetR/AcrR family transcriptional regulator [Pseudomonas sp. PDM16]|uniref:TetR/AcrR family transcriptional regulator n=1 Tax=Pseudomonas sp. PDM16 TaxID=2769292 RepID=UPI0017845667|nr:TetR/AcrR family transcriptional regulator [Pseudomonas sp. PDM16]
MSSDLEIVMSKGNASERSYRGISPEQRIKVRREAFLQAGIRLFGTTGYRATTVRDLCAEAKLTDRYFYESFSGTEDLLAAAYTSIMGEIEQALSRQIQHAGADTDRHQVLETFIRAMREPTVARIVLFEVLGVSERIDNLYQQNNLRFCNLLLSGLSRLYGGLKPVSSELYVCMGIIGAINQMAVCWYLSGYRDPIEVLVESAEQVIMGCSLGIDPG